MPEGVRKEAWLQRGTLVGNALHLVCGGSYMNISSFEHLSNGILIMGESFVSTLYFNKLGGVEEKKNLCYWV